MAVLMEMPRESVPPFHGIHMCPPLVRRIGTLRENQLDFSYFKNQLLDPETMNSIDLVLLLMAFVALIVGSGSTLT